jgi:7-cyano-7-deazaguanine synthase
MKAVVLLSGGVDSTTCLAVAVDKYGAENVAALSAYYGQKHSNELESADAIARFYNVKHITEDLSKVFSLSNCSLLKHSTEEVKHSSYAEQLGELGGEGTVATYVPFRNGLLLSFATAVAISLGAKVIYYGAHSDDAAGRAYPDCTPEFENAMNAAIYEGSGRLLQLEAPLLNMNKAAVVKLGLSLNAPYNLSWSCYEGGDLQCGCCGTCLDRKAAFEANGVVDPVGYIV